jgi:hypothetical protein
MSDSTANQQPDPATTSRGRRWRGWLAVAAAAAYLGLLALPSTRWLVLFQLRTQVPAPAPVASILKRIGVRTPAAGRDPAAAWRTARRTAQRHPGDYQIQLALLLLAASNEEPGIQTEMTRTGRDIAARFATYPSLHANVLRVLADRHVVLDRPEEALITASGGKRDTGSMAERPPQAQALEMFDEVAATGEARDPENAFFPFVRAVGLFAGYYDDEALATIRRAGKKRRWEDYTSDAMEGEWRLEREALGDRSALARQSTQGSFILPHLAGVRHASRVAIARAMQAEEAGDPEEGLAIRHAVMRCGSLMREQSRNLFGSIVGVAITRIATARPGGEPPAAAGRGLPADRVMQIRLDQYCNYLRRIGHPGEARWARRELAAGQRVRDISQRALGASVGGVHTVMDLAVWWMLDLLALSNVIWMLVLAGVTALLGRCTRLGWRWAAWVVVAALAISVLAAWHAPWTDVFRDIHRVVTELAAPRDGDIAVRLGFAPRLARILSHQLLAVLLAVGAPLLATLGAAVAALVRREALSRELVRGLRRLAVPLAAGATIAYACLILATSLVEPQAQRALDEMLRHEGRYFARQVNQPWPGDTLW